MMSSGFTRCDACEMWTVLNPSASFLEERACVSYTTCESIVTLPRSDIPSRNSERYAANKTVN